VLTLASLDDVSLTLGGQRLLDGFSLQIHEGDHIGLVGPNGSGKSSLLRLLCGELEPDAGAVRTIEGVRVGFLPQEIDEFPDERLLSFVYRSVAERPRLEEALGRADERLDALQTEGGDEPALLDAASEVAELHERLAELEARFSEHAAQRILDGLGFAQGDHERPLSQLSGGWRMRAVLASLLFQKPGLLLLDEPTNHLDMPSVAWFSGFLRDYEHALFLVSHDREFLNEQVNRIVSFEPEGIRTFKGDYEQYLARREEEKQVLENRAKNLEREKAHLEQFVRRFRAKASKAAQVQSRLRKLEKMEDVELHRAVRRASFSFPPTSRGPRVPLRVENLSKSFGRHQVFDHVTLAVEREDRIAVVGPNGAGKTTLLRILADEVEPSRGRVHLPGLSEVRYFAQHHADELGADRSVFEEVMLASDGESAERVRSVLGALLFDQHASEKKVTVLSGGERARVALAKILVRPGNVLLMDEPTNHLDLQTTEALTDALRTFDGTLIFVSHNRAFIRRLATKLWVVQGGGVESYPGTLDDYLWSCADREVTPGIEQHATRHQDTKPKSARKEARRREAEARARHGRVIKPLEEEVSSLERRIAELEQTIARHGEQLSRPELYEAPSERDAAIRDMNEAQQELESSLERWGEAHERLEQLRKSGEP